MARKLPPRDAEEYELVRRVKAARGSTDEAIVASGKAAFERLVELGERSIRYFVNRADKLNIDVGDARSQAVEIFHEIVTGYDDKNPYFWSHTDLCLARRFIHFVEHQRKQRREQLVGTIEDDSALHIADDSDAYAEEAAETARIARSIEIAVATELNDLERELFWWTVEGGTVRAFSQLKKMSTRQVGDLRKALQKKVKAVVKLRDESEE